MNELQLLHAQMAEEDRMRWVHRWQGAFAALFAVAMLSIPFWVVWA